MECPNEAFWQNLVDLGFNENCLTNRTSISERNKQFSIRPRQGEIVLQVKLDGCQFTDNEKRCDTLFIGRPVSGPFVVVLVELKGKNLLKAVQQIEATLKRLCAQSTDNLPHTSSALGLTRTIWGAQHQVRAYIVCSSGRKLPQMLSKLDRIWKQYRTRVTVKERRVTLDGISSMTT